MSEEEKKKKEEEEQKAKDEANKNKSWRDQAKGEGYEFLPKADMDTLRGESKDLKDMRVLFPEDYRGGKESEFFTLANDSIKKVEDGTAGSPDLEKITGELKVSRGNLTRSEKKATELETANAELSKTNHNLTMWGIINNERATRNVYVADVLIKDGSVDVFPIDEYDTADEKGQKALGEAVWEKILEPALKEQNKISGREGSSTEPRRGSEKSGTEKDGDDDKDRAIPTSFGSLA